jgi:lipopolysaccharide transport system ATP-binding protein
MKPIIDVKNISKKYNINHQKGGYIAFRDIFANALRHPFSFLKQSTKEAFGINTKEVFWALKDINFTVEKGEVIGIIGRNGAGKSTLLKILSQITPPTTGEIKIHGRVGSLLEVGTGFHPELTGRENIFLNGAILGMKKTEIIEKFEQIVAFAGIEKFLDTPVKYYSSGMYVRLAFSVAAHMEPDILIVDEVLAVGDAEFQKKCLGKMEEITEADGRTILFVSHNLDAIRRLCKKTIWINAGEVVMHGNTADVLRAYTQQGLGGTTTHWSAPDYVGNEYFSPKIFEAVTNNTDITVRIEADIQNLVDDLTIGYALYNDQQELLYWSYQTDVESITLQKGYNVLTSKLPIEILNTGSYTIELIGGIHGKTWFFEPNRGNPTVTIHIERDFSAHPYWNQKRPGILAPRLPWNH